MILIMNESIDEADWKMLMGANVVLRRLDGGFYTFVKNRYFESRQGEFLTEETLPYFIEYALAMERNQK